MRDKEGVANKGVGSYARLSRSIRPPTASRSLLTPTRKAKVCATDAAPTLPWPIVKIWSLAPATWAPVMDGCMTVHFGNEDCNACSGLTRIPLNTSMSDAADTNGVKNEAMGPGSPPSRREASENPYLVHLAAAERFTGGASSSSDALSGFLPRKVTAQQVLKALESQINPFPSIFKPYSQKYWDILAKRKALPVFAQMEDFLQKFQENQVLVMIGETGSGKTTQ